MQRIFNCVTRVDHKRVLQRQILDDLWSTQIQGQLNFGNARNIVPSSKITIANSPNAFGPRVCTCPFIVRMTLVVSGAVALKVVHVVERHHDLCV